MENVEKVDNSGKDFHVAVIETASIDNAKGDFKCLAHKATLAITKLASICWKVGKMMIKTNKTKVLCFEQGFGEVVREENVQEYSLHNKDFKSKCENCQKCFPNNASLIRHKRHCQLPTLDGLWTINKIVDHCDTTTGSFYRVNWDISKCVDGTNDHDTWEPTHRIIQDSEQLPQCISDYCDSWGICDPPQRGGPDCDYHCLPKCSGGDFQCDYCPTWWKTATGCKIHEARCTLAPKQRGVASKSAEHLRNNICKLHLSNRSPVQCPNYGAPDVPMDDLEFVPRFNYLGNLTNYKMCSLTDIKHRLAIARSRFGSMMSMWKDKLLPIPLKLKIYRAYIGTSACHSHEAWRFDDQARRCVNGFNAKCLSTITGRTIVEEARSPTLDLVLIIRRARLAWLGHVLRMDKDRGLLRSLEAYIHNNNKASILLDAPKFKDFKHLVYLASNRTLWRKHLKCIKGQGCNLIPRRDIMNNHLT